jgi:cell division septum initiation protein DivIVA
MEQVQEKQLLSEKIKNKKFVPSKNLFGNFTNQETSYSSKEVDGFFTEIYSGTIKYEEAILRLKNRNKVLEDNLKKNDGFSTNQVSEASSKVIREVSTEADGNKVTKIQKHMTGLLIEAERMAENAKAEAYEEAEQIKQEARDQASELLQRAQEKASEMTKIAQERIEQLKFAREEIEQKASAMREELEESATEAEQLGAKFIDMGTRYKQIINQRKQA